MDDLGTYLRVTEILDLPYKRPGAMTVARAVREIDRLPEDHLIRRNADEAMRKYSDENFGTPVRIVTVDGHRVFDDGLKRMRAAVILGLKRVPVTCDADPVIVAPRPYPAAS